MEKEGEGRRRRSGKRGRHLPSSFLRGMEFLKGAISSSTAPPSHPHALLGPAAPSNAPFTQTHSPCPGAVWTSECPQARHPLLEPRLPSRHSPGPPSSRTRPAPRLQLLSRQSPPPPRARPPTALAQARSHRKAARPRAPGRVPDSSDPRGGRAQAQRRHFERELSRAAGSVTGFLERMCPPATFLQGSFFGISSQLAICAALCSKAFEASIREPLPIPLTAALCPLMAFSLCFQTH